MDELTIILFVATFVIFGISLQWKDIRVNVLGMTVGICAIGQIFNDTAITDSMTPLALIPMVAVLIFSGVAIMGVGKS